MDELERRIRAANPLSTRRDSPLSMRAEDDLRRILSSTPDAAAARRPHRGPLARLRSLTLPGRIAFGGLGAVALGTAVALVVTVATPAPSWAVTPPPLKVTPVSGSVGAVIGRLADAAAAQPAPDYSGDIRVESESWSLPVGLDGYDTRPSHWVQPEHLVSLRHPDGSGTLTFTAGRWLWGVPPGNTATKVGAVIERTDAKSGELVTTVPRPTSAVALESAAPKIAPESTLPVGKLFSTITYAENDWGDLSGIALRTLAGAREVSALGQVTDRLGRRGIALSTPDVVESVHLTRTLIFDESTGELLSSEVSYRSGGSVDLPAGAVVSYVSWEDR